MKKQLILGVILIVSVGIISTQVVQAQPRPLPHWNTARVSLVQGQVSVRHADSRNWVVLTAHSALVAGDQLATDSKSRAELQMESFGVLRAT